MSAAPGVGDAPFHPPHPYSLPSFPLLGASTRKKTKKKSPGLRVLRGGGDWGLVVGSGLVSLGGALC